MKVGEHGAARLEPLDPFEGLSDRKMRAVALVAQRVDDPQIETFEILQALRRDRMQVRGIGHVADAESQGVHLAMFEPERRRLDGSARTIEKCRAAEMQPVFGQQRRVETARRRLEDIVELGRHDLRGRLVHIGRNLSPVHDDEPAHIVDAMRVVGVGMGIENGVETLDLGVDQLLAQVRGRVDENIG